MKPVVNPEPSHEELLQIVAKATEAGDLPEGFVEKWLTRLRAATGEKALATADVGAKKELPPEQTAKLLVTLRSRFERNKELHPRTQWSVVEKSLQARPDMMWSLNKMEETGGEPDVFEDAEDAFVFGDCSAESPSGRRNCVFDKAAEAELQKGSFNGNAVDMAQEMGVDLMDEAQYRALQELLPLDAKTWSWLKTPADVRGSGHALLGDRNGSSVRVSRNNPYARVVYRAFRAALRVAKA